VQEKGIGPGVKKQSVHFRLKCASAMHGPCMITKKEKGRTKIKGDRGGWHAPANQAQVAHHLNKTTVSKKLKTRLEKNIQKRTNVGNDKR